MVKWCLCATVAVCGCYVIVDSQLNPNKSSRRAWCSMVTSTDSKSVFPFSLIAITTNMTSWSRNASVVWVEAVPSSYKLVYWIDDGSAVMGVPGVVQNTDAESTKIAVPFEWTDHMRAFPDQYKILYRLVGPHNDMSPTYDHALPP